MSLCIPCTTKKMCILSLAWLGMSSRSCRPQQTQRIGWRKTFRQSCHLAWHCRVLGRTKQSALDLRWLYWIVGPEMRGTGTIMSFEMGQGSMGTLSVRVREWDVRLLGTRVRIPPYMTRKNDENAHREDWRVTSVKWVGWMSDDEFAAVMLWSIDWIAEAKGSE